MLQEYKDMKESEETKTHSKNILGSSPNSRKKIWLKLVNFFYKKMHVYQRYYLECPIENTDLQQYNKIIFAQWDCWRGPEGLPGDYPQQDRLQPAAKAQLGAQRDSDSELN